jgi:hypothetical protein
LEKIELDKVGLTFASNVGRLVDEVEFECIVLVPTELEVGNRELEALETTVLDKLKLDREEEIDVGRMVDEVEFECIALLLKELVLDEREVDELVKTKL